jgi:hypothetical protein
MTHSLLRAATAETERRWMVRGKTASGGKWAISINAFDYYEAKRKADAKKGGGEIHDIILKDYDNLT